MIGWIGIVLLGGAATVVIRWALRPYDALGRKKSFPWLAVVPLVALAVAALAPWALRIRLERRLSTAASAIAGAPVDVRCQTFGQAFIDTGAELGYVRFGPQGTPEPWTLIKRDGCSDLAEYLASDKEDPSRAQIVAVHTITHEAIHLRGVRDEASTECLAVQHDARLARLLGASPDGARDLAILYWQTVYPHMPPDYKSPECAAGRELDAGLPGAPWSPAP